MSLYEFVNPYFWQESAAEGEEDGKKVDVLIICMPQNFYSLKCNYF
jgi:hypothetical protein